MDGAALMQAVIGDSLVNLVSGMGTEKDRGTQSRFVNRGGLNRNEVDTIYSQNWLGGKVVDIPADDAVREWRQWYSKKADVGAIEAEEQRLALVLKVNEALKYGAKDGGGALLLGVPGDPKTEFDPETLPRGGLSFIHVVSRWELSLTEIELDPRKPWFGQAKMWRMFTPNGGTIEVHPSRVVPFIHNRRADSMVRQDPWGNSVFERLHDSIRDATTGSQIAASLLHEAKVDVIKIPGLTKGVVNPEYRQAVIQRFSLAMSMKSLNNTLLMDGEEEWEQKQLHFQGLPEVMEKLLAIVAGAADMPVTRLLGRSPAGMNATGKADLEAYYTMVRSRQKNVLTPAMRVLDTAVIRSALGRKPRDIYYEWRSLWSMPETDLADVAHKRSMAIEALARAGIFNREALQMAAVQQLEEDGFLPDIGEAVKAHPGVPSTLPAPTPPPEVIAAQAKAKASAGAETGGPRKARPNRKRPSTTTAGT